MKRREFLAAAGALTAGPVRDDRASARVDEDSDALSRATRQRVERLVEDAMRERGIPGLCATVTRGGRTLFRRAWGKSDVELDARMTTGNVLHLASSSKMFAGTRSLVSRRVCCPGAGEN